MLCTWHYTTSKYSHLLKLAAFAQNQLSLLHIHFRLGIHSIKEYSPEEREDRLKNYFKFMFVRHPLTRLVSAYRQKIENGKLTKLLGLKTMSFMNKTITRDSNFRITFNDFVSYVTKGNGTQLSNKHWQTYGRLCRPCDISYDFIGRQELLEGDAKYLFQTHFRHIQFADKGGADFGNNFHRTNSNLETTQSYFSQLTREKKYAVIRRYGDDMEMFGYERSDIF